MGKSIRVILVVGLVGLVVAACKEKPFEAAGSCISYSNSQCWDLAVVNDDVKKICSGGAFDLKDKPCDRADVVGGCRSGNMLVWYKTTTGIATAADVKKKCEGKAFVSKDGKQGE